jgi:hypothetical protein
MYGNCIQIWELFILKVDVVKIIQNNLPLQDYKMEGMVIMSKQQLLMKSIKYLSVFILYPGAKTLGCQML